MAEAILILPWGSRFSKLTSASTEFSGPDAYIFSIPQCSLWPKVTNTPKWVLQFLEQISSRFFFYLFRHPWCIWRIIWGTSLDFFLAITFLIITTDFKHQYSFGCLCIARVVSSISQNWGNLVPRIELAMTGKTGQMLWFISFTKLPYVSNTPSLVKLWTLIGKTPTTEILKSQRCFCSGLHSKKCFRYT